MNITGKITKWGIMLATVFAGLSFSSCSDMIYDDEGDCKPYYRVKFKYDMNMKFADAFHNEVTSVNLYVFDKNGVLVHKQSESGSALASEDYLMQLEIDPGEYDLLAWCGLGDGESFTVPEAVPGTTRLADLTASMNRAHDENGKAHNNRGADGLGKDLNPLFHGLKHVVLADEEGTHIETLSLTKDTNVVRVVLQHLSGNDVDPSLFRFEITDDNGLLGHDNTPLADEYMHYAPWSVTGGSADINADIYGTGAVEPARAGESVSVAVAEFTVSRLMTYKRPVLAIYNVEKGTRVLSVPLVDYALLVKGNYNRPMDDQEYLDRQDEYNLTFFLDEAGLWASSVIYINSWRVVLQDHELK